MSNFFFFIFSFSLYVSTLILLIDKMKKRLNINLIPIFQFYKFECLENSSMYINENGRKLL